MSFGIPGNLAGLAESPSDSDVGGTGKNKAAASPMPERTPSNSLLGRFADKHRTATLLDVHVAIYAWMILDVFGKNGSDVSCPPIFLDFYGASPVLHGICHKSMG